MSYNYSKIKKFAFFFRKQYNNLAFWFYKPK